jgi:hypothetical protein
MYCRPYAAAVSSHWSSMVADTVPLTRASSMRRRIRSAAPKKLPVTCEPGLAISSSRVRRSTSSSSSGSLSRGSPMPPGRDVPAGKVTAGCGQVSAAAAGSGRLSRAPAAVSRWLCPQKQGPGKPRSGGSAR